MLRHDQLVMDFDLMSDVVDQTYDRAWDFDRVNFLWADVEDFLSKHLYVDDFLVARKNSQRQVIVIVHEEKFLPTVRICQAIE